VTRERLAVLQWLGLGLGGIAWFSYHMLGYFLTEGTCDSAGFSINHDLWQAVLMSVAAALVLAAGAAAVAVLVDTRGTSYDAEAPPGRIRFFAMAAVTANLLFLMIVLLDGLGAIFNMACTQA
jgi:hypothetical protein